MPAVLGSCPRPPGQSLCIDPKPLCNDASLQTARSPEPVRPSARPLDVVPFLGGISVSYFGIRTTHPKRCYVEGSRYYGYYGKTTQPRNWSIQDWHHRGKLSALWGMCAFPSKVGRATGCLFTGPSNLLFGVLVMWLS